MKRANFFFIYIAVCFFLFFLMFLHASIVRSREKSALNAKREMVRKFELTDLCLFTEANYTRHLTQADLHTPFQDAPSSLEHFPSGGIVAPPEIIRRINEKLD